MADQAASTAAGHITSPAPSPEPPSPGIPLARFLPSLPQDPGYASLRRATRAAIVIPIAFAFAKLVLGNLQTMTFVVFGCFALLVMADFGGQRPARALAYMLTCLVGSLLVVLGTLVSPIAALGALVMLAVGACIQFAGVFGSYVAAAQTALLLSFVLAVSVPGPHSAVGPRLLGWLIAGMVSTLSGVFFWPRFERVHLRAAASTACRDLARFIAARRTDNEADATDGVLESARRSVAAVRDEYNGTPKRPAGPARRDRAFVEMLADLERLLEFATRPFGLHPRPAPPCIRESGELTAAVARALDASAAVLSGGGPPDLDALETARLAHRRALDAWAGDSLVKGVAAEAVLAGLDADQELRVMSYLALAIASNATLVAGAAPTGGVDLPAGTPLEGRTRPLRRIVRTVRTYLNPSSSVLHQSLRVGLGLAVAVFLARVLRLDHAFWVVLGTLSVLRSNAFGTGRTTVEALGGTVLGFAVGGAFALIAGTTSPAMWVALPIAVFLATYAAGAIGFVVGQAAFTVLVIILFNLISPVGWRVGLVRIEDVGLGVAISVIAALVLWPRGARAEFARALAGLYRDVATYLGETFARVLTPDVPDQSAAARGIAVRARDRAGEAFDQFLHERGTKPIDPQRAGLLVSGGANAILAADALNTVAATGYVVRMPSTADNTLVSQTQLMLTNLRHLADRLDRTPARQGPRADVSERALREAALWYLQSWRENPDVARSALAAVIAGEWVQQLAQLTKDLDGPTAGAVEAARIPWWR